MAGAGMKIYLLSLGAGVLAGLLYGVIGVRSPAPPLVALVGLLGILVGEQLPGFARRWLHGPAATSSADAAPSEADKTP